MRSTFLIALVAVITLPVSGQVAYQKELENATVQMGEIIDHKFGEGLTQFVGEWEGGVVTLISHKGTDLFQRYDKDLKLVKSNSIEHSSLLDGKSTISNHGFLVGKSKSMVKRLVGATSKKTKSNTLYVVDFDMETLQMSNWVEVSKVEGKYFDDFHNSWVGFKYSLDSSHVLVSHLLPEEERVDVQFSVVVLSGDDLSVKWQQSFDLHQKGGAIPLLQGRSFGEQWVGKPDATHLNYEYITTEMCIDNSGVVYTWAHFDLGRGVEVEERFPVKTLVINQDGITMSIVNLQNGHYLPRNDFGLVQRPEGCLLIGGLLTKVEEENLTAASIVNKSNEHELTEADVSLFRGKVTHRADGSMIVRVSDRGMVYLGRDLKRRWNIDLGYHPGMYYVNMYVSGDKCYAVYQDFEKNAGDIWINRAPETYEPERGDVEVGMLASWSISDIEEGQREVMYPLRKLEGYAPNWVNYMTQFGSNYYRYVREGNKKGRIIKVKFK
ncbi:MAG: hypothetical protein GC178_01995 [Flavobacteriales bacterium]|nr:hypothetical protein [Flavobacteriales bacterium]